MLLLLYLIYRNHLCKTITNSCFPQARVLDLCLVCKVSRGWGKAEILVLGVLNCEPLLWYWSNVFRRQYENNDRNGEAVKLLRGETKCPFGKDYFCQLILLFSLFLLLFMGPTTLFVTIHGSHYTISANFYRYIQYFQQKVFSFNKINGSQTDLT